jgi:hypothetical protein
VIGREAADAEEQVVAAVVVGRKQVEVAALLLVFVFLAREAMELVVL